MTADNGRDEIVSILSIADRVIVEWPRADETSARDEG